MKSQTVINWRTPASFYPLGRTGNIEIVRQHLPGGNYPIFGRNPAMMHLLDGEVTLMKIDDEIVAMDDPANWFAMKDCMDGALPGVMLVGGLGLGLAAWTQPYYPRAHKLVFVEQSEYVIDVIKYAWKKSPPPVEYDFVLGDFWTLLPVLVERVPGVSSIFMDVFDPKEIRRLGGMSEYIAAGENILDGFPKFRKIHMNNRREDTGLMWWD